MSAKPLNHSLFSEGFAPTFSGHETFTFRSTWLKKAYDLLSIYPNLFSRDDAIVLLGVGKNMVQSIRFWGRVCGVFQRNTEGDGYQPTALGHAWLNDYDGWDPFFVSPTSWWLLHWNITAHPEAAFTWFYTFNLLRGGEFTSARLATQIQAYAEDHSWRVPSDSTINRDIECLIHSYSPPTPKQISTGGEDALLCPLSELKLLELIPNERIYTLVTGYHPTLPDELIGYAIYTMMMRQQRQTISFSDLAYAPRSPGRVFRLDEDSLLTRLYRIHETMDGNAYYTDQAGVRQVAWAGTISAGMELTLLSRMFEREVRNV